MRRVFQSVESRRGWAVVVAGLGLAMVILGAAGAHLLSNSEPSALSRFETALEYHQIHTLAMAAWVWATPKLGRLEAAVLCTWLVGIVLFSGGLYGLAFFHDHPLRSLTPLGGISLMGGWVLSGISSWRRYGNV